MLSLSGDEIAYICAITVFAYSLRGATGFGAASAVGDRVGVPLGCLYM